MTNDGLTFKRVAGACGVSTHTLKDNVVHLLGALPVEERISVLEYMVVANGRVKHVPAPPNPCPECGSAKLLVAANPDAVLKCEKCDNVFRIEPSVSALNKLRTNFK